MGGLGNQMFQYAFGKALEYKLGIKVLYDASWFFNADRIFELNVFNINVPFAMNDEIKISKGKCKKTILPGELRKIFNLPKYYDTGIIKQKPHGFYYDTSLFKKTKRSYYEGYFQNEKFLYGIEDIIKKDFQFRNINPNDKLNNDIAEKIKNCENSVFIHVRRGDYLTGGFPVLDQAYYKKAIKVICEKIKNPTFFIFGQNCTDWILNNFDIGEKYYIIGEHNSRNNDDYIDMQLMSMCKHGIVANSSFSWWGAWLIDNKSKIIIAPEPWFDKTSEIICDSWIKIKRNTSQTLVVLERERERERERESNISS